MKSDKGFFDFLGSQGRGVKLMGIIVVGIALLMMGGLNMGGGSEEKAGEERIAEMCMLMDGVGECRVMMTYRQLDGEDTVYAVLVLCEGADSPSVRARITSLVSSLYGIGSHRVEIQRLNK